MVSAYMLAQTALYFEQKPGSLIVLGTSNADESYVIYIIWIIKFNFNIL